jgi:hypothetical protein
MATPNVAAAMPRAVVTFTRRPPGATGRRMGPPSVAKVAALEVLAVEGQLDVGGVHGSRVVDAASGQAVVEGRQLI